VQASWSPGAARASGWRRLRLAEWEVLPFDQRAAVTFERLRQQRVRIGTMDLKIAAMALAYNALVLSANLRDLQQVPGLDVEDWRQ
jgi:tRNA(fMet)-specific endonuclease VapC